MTSWIPKNSLLLPSKLGFKQQIAHFTVAQTNILILRCTIRNFDIGNLLFLPYKTILIRFEHQKKKPIVGNLHMIISKIKQSYNTYHNHGNSGASKTLLSDQLDKCILYLHNKSYSVSF